MGRVTGRSAIDNRNRLLGEILALVAVVALILVFSIRWKGGGSPSTDAHRILMGTIVSVTVFSANAGEAAEAIDAAFEEIARVEALTTRYSSDSEISRLNAAAGGDSAVQADPEVMTVLRRAIEVSRLSGGAFDVTVAPVVDLWTFGEGGSVPSRESIEEALPLVDYRRVLLDTVAGSLLLPPDVAIDLDAIAKGYAVDRAVAVLREHGIPAAIVDAGGDVGLLGESPRGGGWRVGVKHPRRDGILGVLTLDGGSAATSGDYQRYTMIGDRRYHHVLDPATGYPAQGVLSVTVVAKTAMDADALATAVFVMGPERGLEAVEGLPGVEAVIVTGDQDVRQVITSSGLRGRFHAPD